MKSVIESKNVRIVSRDHKLEIAYKDGLKIELLCGDIRKWCDWQQARDHVIKVKGSLLGSHLFSDDCFSNAYFKMDIDDTERINLVFHEDNSYLSSNIEIFRIIEMEMSLPPRSLTDTRNDHQGKSLDKDI